MDNEVILALIGAFAVPMAGWIVNVVLMRRKYVAEVDKLKAEIDSISKSNSGVNVDNTQKLIDMIISNVVTPLESEIKKLRLSNGRLTRAIDKIADCPTPDTCPVTAEIRRQETNNNKSEQNE